MSLYDNKERVEQIITDFTELHECSTCGNYFTEIENIGCWNCKYHPGEYDPDTETYSCCGEKYRRPAFGYKGYGHIMTWGVKDRWDHIKPLSSGCTACDCRSKDKNSVPYKDIDVSSIAQLIPYMTQDIRDRPGLDTETMKLVRKCERPKWAKPSQDAGTSP